MIKNKRGLSGVIVTLITVLLAIVAIGIVWVVISSIVDSNVDSIDLNTKCQGAIISIDSVEHIAAVEAATNPPVSAVAESCTVTIKRLPGITQEAIDGVSMSIDGTSLDDEPNDIVTEQTFTVTCTAEPSTATARVYFEIDGENKYCPSVSWTA